MSGYSGRRLREPFAYYDPDTSTWRMSQPLLPLENLPEQLATWPYSGMWDSGAAYALPTLVPLMAEHESLSLLPTPLGVRYGDSGKQSHWRNSAGTFRAMEKALPTPRGDQGQSGDRNGQSAADTEGERHERGRPTWDGRQRH